MKKIIFYLAVIFIPSICRSQSTQQTGIRWLNGLTWPQVLSKAKSEGKYIFVDCFATWCAPCKAMDKNVYVDTVVSRFMNEHFLNVQLQMDSTASDSKQVKDWYRTAHEFLINFKITSFPTYLFISSEGQILDKDFGYKKPETFLLLANNELNSKFHFYPLLKKFQTDKLEFSYMPYVAKKAMVLKYEEQAGAIARKYVYDYLFELPANQLFTKTNIKFIHEFPMLFHSNERLFKFIVDNQARIDSAMKSPGFAEEDINFIIYVDDVGPAILESKKANVSPRWDEIASLISKKYGAGYVDKNLIRGRLFWFETNKDWINLARTNVLRIERYGLDTAGPIAKGLFNNMIWSVIFLHIEDTSILSKAVNWSRMLMEADPENPNAIDTYANLLYKYGNVEQAIKFQKMAVLLDTQLAEKNGRKLNKSFQNNLYLMESGKPTW